MGENTHKHRTVNRSFDLFSVYDYYSPDIKGVLILLGMFVIGIILSNLVMALILLVGDGGVEKYSTLIAYPLMFIPAMIYAANKSRFNSMFDKPVRIDGANLGRLGWWGLIPMVMVVILAGAALNDMIMKLLPETPEWFERAMEKALVGMPLWATLLSVSVFAPLFEEWLCRGMILRGLMQTKLGPAWAIAISSLIFAVIHMNPWQAVAAFVLGLLMGYVYYKTGSLKLTVLMHCTNNTFSALLGQDERIREMASFSELMGTGAYIAMQVAAAVVVVLFIWAMKKYVPDVKQAE